MVLVFDAGNTNITIGAFDGGVLAAKWSLNTDVRSTEDEYYIRLSALMELAGINERQIEGAIIGSVVPGVTRTFTRLFRKYFGKEPVTINERTKLGVKNLYKNKSEVGDDRLADAVAAKKMFPGKDAVIIDFGTAVSFEAVNKKGEYLGGAIMPGINLSIRSLYSGTAKLPLVSIKKNGKYIGNTTEKSVNSGIFYSMKASVAAITEGIKKEMKAKNAVILLTGGDASSEFAEGLGKNSVVIDKELTLKGFYEIYKLNKKRLRT